MKKLYLIPVFIIIFSLNSHSAQTKQDKFADFLVGKWSGGTTVYLMSVKFDFVFRKNRTFEAKIDSVAESNELSGNFEIQIGIADIHPGKYLIVLYAKKQKKRTRYMWSFVVDYIEQNNMIIKLTEWKTTVYNDIKLRRL